MKSALCCIGLLVAMLSVPLWAEDSPEKKDEGLMNLDFSSQRTVIEADALTLYAKKRAFTYRGNVSVVQGDLELICGKLDGTYTETNEIDSLIATEDVYIEKGPSIKATGQRAVFNSADQTLTLLENPELIQQGSILSADEVVIYLQEDRSEAIGSVRVTIIDSSAEEPEPDAADAAESAEAPDAKEQKKDGDKKPKSGDKKPKENDEKQKKKRGKKSK